MTLPAPSPPKKIAAREFTCVVCGNKTDTPLALGWGVPFTSEGEATCPNCQDAPEFPAAIEHLTPPK